MPNPDSVESPELARSIGEVYAGALEDFVTRRNSLAKELKAAGRREDAEIVKTLRKPTRTAWALNAAAAADAASTDRIAAAIGGILDAQSGGGDLRESLVELREAVQQFAGKAADAAKESGHAADQGALVNAVMAVIGSAGTFTLLQSARLADVPEAGGLDFLTSLPPVTTRPRPVRVVRPDGEDAQDIALRDAVRHAEAALTAARERSTKADQALRSAQVEADDADRRLRLAQKEAHARQSDLDRARKESQTATEELHLAETALADANQLRVSSRDK